MNPEPGGLTLRFEVDGDDFTSAGQASVQVKKSLRQLGISPDIIRKVSIAMYEGEINMVIHAGGGVADVCTGDCGVVLTEYRYLADSHRAVYALAGILFHNAPPWLIRNSECGMRNFGVRFADGY